MTIYKIWKNYGYIPFFISIIMFLNGFFNHAISKPWFTGPLLAQRGKNISRGDSNLEIYGFSTKNNGAYNRHWKAVSVPVSENMQITPLFAYGLSNFVDVQYSLPYVINHAHGKRHQHIGDATAQLGFQLIEQNESKWRPNVRFVIQEAFPTGKYEGLNPTNEGTDGTGLGSYQTIFSVNFQHLLSLEHHYLRTRLVLSYLYAAPVQVRGYTTFGGNMDTLGTVYPGNLIGMDLAGELTLTQNWVAVMEGYYYYRAAQNFKGNPGRQVDGKVPVLSSGVEEEISLAPAIEYNFSANYGVIGGMWFSVRGKNAPRFRSTVIAFNAYW